MRSLTHQESITIHARKRAKERYGLWLSDDIFRLSKEIKQFKESGNGSKGQFRGCNIVLLYREIRDKSKYHYLIDWRNKYYWAVWNDTVQRINTFLPLDGLGERIGFMTNAIIGLLSSRNLINLGDYKLFDVGNVTPAEVNNRDEVILAYSESDTLHHSIHSQPQQLLDAPLG